MTTAEALAESSPLMKVVFSVFSRTVKVPVPPVPAKGAVVTHPSTKKLLFRLHEQTFKPVPRKTDIFKRNGALFEYEEVHDYFLYEACNKCTTQLPHGDFIGDFVDASLKGLAIETQRLYVKYTALCTKFSTIFNRVMTELVKLKTDEEHQAFCKLKRAELMEMLFHYPSREEAGLSHDLERIQELYRVCPSPKERKGVIEEDETGKITILLPHPFKLDVCFDVPSSSLFCRQEVYELTRFTAAYSKLLDYNIVYLESFIKAVSRVIGILECFPGPYPQEHVGKITQKELILLHHPHLEKKEERKEDSKSPKS